MFRSEDAVQPRALLRLDNRGLASVLILTQRGVLPQPLCLFLGVDHDARRGRFTPEYQVIGDALLRSLLRSLLIDLGTDCRRSSRAGRLHQCLLPWTFAGRLAAKSHL